MLHFQLLLCAFFLLIIFLWINPIQQAEQKWSGIIYQAQMLVAHRCLRMNGSALFAIWRWINYQMFEISILTADELEFVMAVNFVSIIFNSISSWECLACWSSWYDHRWENQRNWEFMEIMKRINIAKLNWYSINHRSSTKTHQQNGCCRFGKPYYWFDIYQNLRNA